MNNNEQVLASLPTLIRALGKQTFADTWLKTLNQSLPVDHFSLFTFDSSLKPKVNCSASLESPSITISAGKKYLQYFYLSDPNMRIIGQDDIQSNKPLLLRVRARDITNEQYRKLIYEEYGLCERLSLIGMIDGTWFIANMYRDNTTGGFAKDDIGTVDSLSVLLVSVIEKHLSMVSPQAMQPGDRPSIEWLEEIVTELGSGLTPREIQVCARALFGLTRTGIALNLEIKPPTVSTLTQRAYGKLNISNLNELFARCLQVVTLRQGV